MPSGSFQETQNKNGSAAAIAYALWGLIGFALAVEFFNYLYVRSSSGGRTSAFATILQIAALVLAAAAPFLALAAAAIANSAAKSESGGRKALLRTIAVAAILISFAGTMWSCNPH